VYAANHNGEGSLNDIAPANPEEFVLNERMASPSPLNMAIIAGI
jgi:hypothetical protein